MNKDADVQAWHIRDALAELVADARYTLKEIDRRTPATYSGRSVERYLTVKGSDKALPPLPFVIVVLTLLLEDDRVPEVKSIGQWFDETLSQLND